MKNNTNNKKNITTRKPENTKKTIAEKVNEEWIWKFNETKNWQQKRKNNIYSMVKKAISTMKNRMVNKIKL